MIKCTWNFNVKDKKPKTLQRINFVHNPCFMYLIYLLSTEAASVFSEMLPIFFFLKSAAGINEIVVKDQINSLRATKRGKEDS